MRAVFVLVSSVAEKGQHDQEPQRDAHEVLLHPPPVDALLSRDGRASKPLACAPLAVGA